MNLNRIARPTLIAAAVLSAGQTLAAPPLPETAVPAERLVYAMPFSLDKGYRSDWRSERPMVTAGWLIVAKVDPACVYPRQTAQPVMYVGNQTAERINHGFESGMTIAIVPSTIKENGQLALDLAKSMMFFGTPDLPERIDAARIAEEQQLAVEAGIKFLDGKMIETARQTAIRFDADTNEGIRNFDNKNELLTLAAGLIKRYSPQEEELAEALLRQAIPD